MANKITAKTTLIELAAIVYEHLQKNNISALLTGGAVVSIYTNNKYESYDLDFISPEHHPRLVEIMAKINFKPITKQNRVLEHPTCPITVEFPGSSLNLGAGYEENVDHKENVNGVLVRMLTPTQSVMDRLAHYISKSTDPQGLDQAEWICEKHPVSLKKIKDWAERAQANEEQKKRIFERCERGIKKYTSSI